MIFAVASMGGLSTSQRQPKAYNIEEIKEFSKNIAEPLQKLSNRFVSKVEAECVSANFGEEAACPHYCSSFLSDDTVAKAACKKKCLINLSKCSELVDTLRSFGDASRSPALLQKADALIILSAVSKYSAEIVDMLIDVGLSPGMRHYESQKEGNAPVRCDSAYVSAAFDRVRKEYTYWINECMTVAQTGKSLPDDHGFKTNIETTQTKLIQLHMNMLKLTVAYHWHIVASLKSATPDWRSKIPVEDDAEIAEMIPRLPRWASTSGGLECTMASARASMPNWPIGLSESLSTWSREFLCSSCAAMPISILVAS